MTTLVAEADLLREVVSGAAGSELVRELAVEDHAHD